MNPKHPGRISGGRVVPPATPRRDARVASPAAPSVRWTAVRPAAPHVQAATARVQPRTAAPPGRAPVPALHVQAATARVQPRTAAPPGRLAAPAPHVQAATTRVQPTPARAPQVQAARARAGQAGFSMASSPTRTSIPAAPARPPAPRPGRVSCPVVQCVKPMATYFSDYQLHKYSKGKMGYVMVRLGSGVHATFFTREELTDVQATAAKGGKTVSEIQRLKPLVPLTFDGFHISLEAASEEALNLGHHYTDDGNLDIRLEKQSERAVFEQTIDTWRRANEAAVHVYRILGLYVAKDHLDGQANAALKGRSFTPVPARTLEQMEEERKRQAERARTTLPRGPSEFIDMFADDTGPTPMETTSSESTGSPVATTTTVTTNTTTAAPTPITTTTATPVMTTTATPVMTTTATPVAAPTTATPATTTAATPPPLPIQNPTPLDVAAWNLAWQRKQRYGGRPDMGTGFLHALRDLLEHPELRRQMGL